MVRNQWQPTTFERFEDLVSDSSTGPAIIKTDAGRAYLKAINNPIGPHALAREWVGTKLAKLFGLETFDIAIMNVDEIDEIPIKDGGVAEPGPALVTRAVMDGHPWGGTAKELELLDNPEDIIPLVIFDTWTQNRDRCPPEGMDRRSHRDNVFLSAENAVAGRFRLIAMDHTECFLPTSKDLTGRIRTHARVNDDRIYGLFDAFRTYFDNQTFSDIVNRLDGVDRTQVSAIIREIPREWQVEQSARDALLNLIMDRAAYLFHNKRKLLAHFAWVNGKLN